MRNSSQEHGREHGMHCHRSNSEAVLEIFPGLENDIEKGIS